MTKHTPATPLPWTCQQAGHPDFPGSVWLDSKTNLKPALFMNADDAQFAAITCNAYPRLVDALKTARAILNARGGPSARERDIATMKADALLAELGE